MSDKKPERITICHYNKGNDTWKTIQIQEKHLQRHLDHGDFEGSCEETRTYIPDEGFESYLIYKGYDDILDGYVLTKNIAGIKVLNLPWKEGAGAPCGLCNDIEDLTGI